MTVSEQQRKSHLPRACGFIRAFAGFVVKILGEAEVGGGEALGLEGENSGAAVDKRGVELVPFAAAFAVVAFAVDAVGAPFAVTPFAMPFAWPFA